MITKLFQVFSSSSRKSRALLFNEIFKINTESKVLDLGGGNGNLISKTVPFKDNVWVADICKQDLEQARHLGYKTIALDESGLIPCIKDEFDIIFCNSVIEHVTVDKDQLFNYTTNNSFRKAAFERQQLFANEIRSKCSRYFVQTPYKYFLIESHTWLPVFIVFLPRKLQFKVIEIFNKFWPKKTAPDWNLLTCKEMEQLFPDAKIIREKSFFLTKSLIAVKC